VQKRFRLLGSRLVLPFQIVLRKTAERSSGKKWQRIGNQIDAEMILAQADLIFCAWQFDCSDAASILELDVVFCC